MAGPGAADMLRRCVLARTPKSARHRCRRCGAGKLGKGPASLAATWICVCEASRAQPLSQSSTRLDCSSAWLVPTLVLAPRWLMKALLGRQLLLPCIAVRLSARNGEVWQGGAAHCATV